MQLLPVQPAVGAGQVDKLEEAQLGVDTALRPGMDAPRSVLVDHQHFARFELPHEVGADRVERRGLRRQHPAPRPRACRGTGAGTRAGRGRR